MIRDIFFMAMLVILFSVAVMLDKAEKGEGLKPQIERIWYGKNTPTPTPTP